MNVPPDPSPTYKFNIGDKVQHITFKQLIGVILYQLFDPDTYLNWYGVEWNKGVLVTHDEEHDLISG